MLRHPEIYYEEKRSSSLLKVKQWNEADLEIIDMESGTGKNSNVLGAIIVKGIIDGKEVITKVGSGFSDKLRKEVFESKSKYIGTIAEIKYFEITQNQSEKNKYSLRFPTFTRFRFDK